MEEDRGYRRMITLETQFFEFGNECPKWFEVGGLSLEESDLTSRLYSGALEEGS
jgi:hypothetical protein